MYNKTAEQPTKQSNAEQSTEQPNTEQITISSAIVGEPSSIEQQTGPVTTVEDLHEIEDLPCTPPAS